MKTTKKKNATAGKSTGKKSKGPSVAKKSPPKGDKSEQENFPGYPLYDPGDDITRNQRRVDTNLDDDTLTVDRKLRVDASSIPPSDNDANATTGAGVFDVDKEDLEALGPKDLSLDGNDDEQLKHRTQPVDFAGAELDVPGAELDDDQEEKGSEDEENNVYSLGGDKS